jgi:hypothetical protein
LIFESSQFTIEKARIGVWVSLKLIDEGKDGPVFSKNAKMEVM